MSHVTVTMIGTHEDLAWIYNNCTTDSSSESSAEQAFGYDYLTENYSPYKPTKDDVEEFIKKNPTCNAEYFRNADLVWWKDEGDWMNEPLFTKKDFAWECLMNGNFNPNEVLDLRPRRDWYCVSWDKENKRNRTREELIEWFKQLPDDVTFFFGDAHL